MHYKLVNKQSHNHMHYFQMKNQLLLIKGFLTFQQGNINLKYSESPNKNINEI